MTREFECLTTLVIQNSGIPNTLLFITSMFWLLFNLYSGNYFVACSDRQDC